MDLVIEKLQEKIMEIDNERDAREHQYYREKIKLSAEFETMSSALLSQKLYLKEILKDIQNNMVEQNI